MQTDIIHCLFIYIPYFSLLALNFKETWGNILWLHDLSVANPCISHEEYFYAISLQKCRLIGCNVKKKYKRCTHVHTRIHTFIHIHQDSHSHIYAYDHIYMDVHICIHTHMHAYIFTNAALIYICPHTCTCACTHASMHRYIHIYTCIYAETCMCEHVHRHAHTHMCTYMQICMHAHTQQTSIQFISINPTYKPWVGSKLYKKTICQSAAQWDWTWSHLVLKQVS